MADPGLLLRRDLAEGLDKGIQELIAIQRKVLGEVPLKKPKP